MGRYIKGNQSRYPVAEDAVFEEGDQVWINAEGYAEPAPAPASGVTGIVVGSASQRVDNTGGADGDKFVYADHSCGGEKVFFFPVGALTAADIGKTVYVGANPKSVTTTSTNAVKSGTLQGLEEDGTRVRVVFTF